MKSKAKTPQRQYPRDVWVLSSAYIVKQVTVVEQRCGWSGRDYGDQDASGKGYGVDQMHNTKDAAIAYGRQQIAGRREYLAKQATLLDARTAKLDKAEAK